MGSFLAAIVACFFYMAGYLGWVTWRASALDSTKPLTEYTHTVWTRRDGLPSAFIYAIAQTQDGYIWLGTADGIVRFDGIRFVHWHPKTGPKTLLGVVRALCPARDGGLWVGTASGAVGHILGDELTTFSIGVQVEAILEARDETVWIATRDRILRFRAETQDQTGSAIALPGVFLSGPLEDGSGSIWLTTDTSAIHFDPGNPQDPATETTKGERWLSKDANGNIWTIRRNGFTRPVKNIQTFRRHALEIEPVDIKTVLQDSKGNTWIGSAGQGLVRLPAETGDLNKAEKYSRVDGLSADTVWCFLEDREHNIWVGTQNGLNRFRDEKVATLTSREGLASDSVNALAAGPDASVWTSTSMGVLLLNGEHRDLYLRGTRAMGLLAEGNTLWAGTNRGITRLQDGEWRDVSLPRGLRLADVTAITEDHEHGIWLCDGRHGLYRWNNGRITDFSREPLLKGKAIRVARADHKGSVWFGLYEGGILVFDGTQFRSYSERDGVARGSVNDVFVDANNTVWIGAEAGLTRFDAQRFVTWSRASGLPGDRVLWILTDSNDDIWLGYSTGVARVGKSELDKAVQEPGYRVSFQFLDEADGVKGNPDRQWQSPAVRASDGKFWFRTSEGVAILDPEHLTRNPVPPPVHVERLLADGIEFDTRQPVRLRPLTKNVEIDYTALSFAEPRNVRFRYKLEGFDAVWRDVGARRQAFYTNLQPRAYRFRVLACNNDGVWNESGAAVDFDLLPAFYQTRWFGLLCILIVIILAWGAYRLRVWQVTTHLRDRFEERLKERTRIAQDLHDSLIQEVMGISLQVEVTDQLLPPDLPAKQSLERALRLCKSALQAGRRALNELRSAPLNAGDLVKSFSQLSGEFAREAGTQVEAVVEGRERPLRAVTGHDVLQVGRQAITNAFQHAQATKIHVLLSYGEQHFRMQVVDNGRGIDQENMSLGRPGHYGIAGMQERAERLGGRFSIRSRVGEGTEVELSIPAHLLYQDDVPASRTRLADKWRHVSTLLGIRNPKA
jgi:signal transduction histidine kinase/ligand-binding sensor domain-containing protein